MDSTPNPTPHPHTQPLSLHSSARKLPVKRKTPTTATTDDDGAAATIPDFDSKPPPFKFHRIWTEPDEIRFLQGLLDCSSQRLSFPRDLHIFFSRFSNTMPQPFTKSQLSEKIRRLRKKFRVISSRLTRGLDRSLLSTHDRDLFELSKMLWSPEFASTSPFGNGHGNSKTVEKIESHLVGVKVSFSPTLPFDSHSIDNRSEFGIVDDDDNVDGDGGVDDVKMSEVIVDYDFGGQEDELRDGSGGIGRIVAKCVMSVFDQCLNEVRTVLVRQGFLCPNTKSILGLSGSSKAGKETDFERLWREQRVAELDVLARRLRLVLENSINRQ